MARKPTAPPPSPTDRPGVTPDRFTRLVRLLHLVAEKSLPRDVLTRRLKIDVRGFYRDLGLIRAAGIRLALDDGRYRLADGLETALGLLPFPDPHLTLAEARLLSRGRTPAHRKLREQLERVRP
jgi:predicted DNA-binding transcriptional regulator YafY